MTTASSSSSAQGAREALAVRLQHLRKDAGLTGKELSARCGRHPAKTTRIQKGAVLHSDADIRTWCSACGADDQGDDLIATARAVDSMYMEWRRLHRNGMRQVQQDWYTLHEQSRVYVSNVPRLPPDAGVRDRPHAADHPLPGPTRRRRRSRRRPRPPLPYNASERAVRQE
jgi:transcriptional regulator with XRE-family HTH domain